MGLVGPVPAVAGRALPRRPSASPRWRWAAGLYLVCAAGVRSRTRAWQDGTRPSRPADPGRPRRRASVERAARPSPLTSTVPVHRLRGALPLLGREAVARLPPLDRRAARAVEVADERRRDRDHRSRCSVRSCNSHSPALHAVGNRRSRHRLVALPVGIGVGILKYRLYEIDRLISRTISYLIITGLLVGVFVGIVALATDVLPFSSPVAVAASTLAAARSVQPAAAAGAAARRSALQPCPLRRRSDRRGVHPAAA